MTGNKFNFVAIMLLRIRGSNSSSSQNFRNLVQQFIPKGSGYGGSSGSGGKGSSSGFLASGGALVGLGVLVFTFNNSLFNGLFFLTMYIDIANILNPSTSLCAYVYD